MTADLLTCQQVSAILGVCEETIRQWMMRDGPRYRADFPASRIMSNKARWRRDEIDAFLATAPTTWKGRPLGGRDAR